jgi:DNA invertase Pin-like site-specific DNA recombinase
MEQPYYNAAIYCRLSQDDERSGESLSIQYQKTLLTGYVHENGWRVADCYTDDGISGTTFERGDFKRMLEDIEQGKINMVVTKDLSRLGRDYLKTGYYTEVYFPEHNVRYIAVNDGIDTLDRISDIIPFKNILNEMYAKEISRKLKSSFKAKFDRGEYHGSCAPFGYAKDPDTKKLVIDENSAETIRLIFRLSAQGNGSTKIRDVLIEEKHLTPSAYLHTQNSKYYAKKFENADGQALYEWSTTMLPKLLKDEVYIGNTTHHKEKSLSFKEKQRQQNPKDQWLRIENTHEPIISREIWEAVQERFQSRERSVRTNPRGVLGNIVRCADCGGLMWLSSIQRSRVTGERFKAGTLYMRCITHITFGNTKCSGHNVNYNKLCRFLLDDIRHYAQLALENPTELITALNKSGDAHKQAADGIIKRDYDAKLKRLSELERLLQRLFEENAIGLLTDANYSALAAKYQQEQAVLTQQAEELAAQLQAWESQTDNSLKWTALITKYADLKELDAGSVEELCEKSLMHQAEMVDGERTQKIEIFYRFINEAPVMEAEGGRE